MLGLVCCAEQMQELLVHQGFNISTLDLDGLQYNDMNKLAGLLSQRWIVIWAAVES